jgi:hypothetical protein
MKITLPVTIVFLLISFFVIRQLLQWNEDLSSGDPTRKIHYCNWESAEKCEEAVGYWRNDASRTAIVQKIVKLDFGFQVFYCSFLVMALITQAGKPQPLWLKKWLKLGILLIIIFTLISIYQGHTIYQLVTDVNEKPFDRRFITKFKWVLCAIGLIPLLISIFPSRQTKNI